MPFGIPREALETYDDVITDQDRDVRLYCTHPGCEFATYNRFAAIRHYKRMGHDPVFRLKEVA